MLPNETDLLPTSFLIQFALGRLTPIGVLGDASPASPATVTTLYVTPTTFFFL